MNAVKLSDPVISDAHRALALRIARGFTKKLPPHVLVEDLEQAALMGLWSGLQKAARTDWAHPHLLSYYLAVRIRGAILDELRRQDWLPRHARKNAAHLRVLHGADTVSTDRSWEETLAGPGLENYARMDSEKLVAVGLEALARSGDARDLYVVRAQMRGRTQKDIARELRVSEPRISQLYQRGLRKMRDVLTAPSERLPAAAALASKAPGEPQPPPQLEAATSRASAPPSQSTGRDRLELPVADSVPSVLPDGGIDLPAELARYRDWMIEQALLRSRGNRHAAARLLGISPCTIWRHFRPRRAAGERE